MAFRPLRQLMQDGAIVDTLCDTRPAGISMAWVYGRCRSQLYVDATSKADD